MANVPPKAVLFDRDGVLNIDHGYTHRPQDLEWTPGARAAIGRLNRAGIKVAVVTNQSGVARGLYDLVAVDAFHAAMQADLAEDGARIDAFYACPFHKDAQVQAFRHPDHPDRKPNPGMLRRALADFGVRPDQAVMIGDRGSDMQAAQAAGVIGRFYAGGDLEAFVGDAVFGPQRPIRILQFGATGQVSQAVLAARGDGVSVTALSRAEVDLADTAAVRAAIRAAECDLVLNCAAFTAVDAAEARPAAAYAVNADAPAAMAEACAERDLPLAHLSTDYVFDGDKRAPYVETDETRPLGVYGASKRAGETAVLAWDKGVVIRVAWVFSSFGANFIPTMLRLGRERDEVRVVADQTGSPTCAPDLADFILGAAPRWATAHVGDPAFGLFHFVNAGVATRFELAEAAMARDPAQRAARRPARDADFNPAARRPAYSALDNGKVGRVFGVRPRPWRDALNETMDRILAQA